MRKSTIVAIVTAFILTSASIFFAQASDDQTGKIGTMMSGKSMMGHQGMSDQDMMNRDHMRKGMMSISIFTGESLALQGSGHNNWHMMEKWGMGGFGGFFMMIFWIIIIIGAIYLIKLLMQKSQNNDGPSDRGSSSNPSQLKS